MISMPRSTHTHFVDHLLSNGLSSVKADILSRYVKFLAGLRCSPSMEVRVMAGIVCRDVRTTTGRNVWLLERETGVDPFLTKSWQIKAVLTGKLASIPDMDMWRIMYLSKLLEARGQAYYEGEEYQYLTELVDSLCIS